MRIRSRFGPMLVMEIVLVDGLVKLMNIRLKKKIPNGFLFCCCILVKQSRFERRLSLKANYIYSNVQDFNFLFTFLGFVLFCINASLHMKYSRIYCSLSFIKFPLFHILIWDLINYIHYTYERTFENLFL